MISPTTPKDRTVPSSFSLLKPVGSANRAARVAPYPASGNPTLKTESARDVFEGIKTPLEQQMPPRPAFGNALSSPKAVHSNSSKGFSRDYYNYRYGVEAPVDLRRLQRTGPLPEVLGPQHSTGAVKFGCLRSNENIGSLFPETFRQKHQGGGYLGVGTEQNYTLMGSCKSSHGWLIDINPEVLAVHQLNALAMMYAENAVEYTSFFSPANRQVITSFLKTHHPHLARLYPEYAQEIFPVYNERILSETLVYKGDHTSVTIAPNTQTLLTPKHHQDYCHVRRLFLDGKVRLLQGNIFEDDVLSRVAMDAKQLKETIEITYMSNAVSKRYGNLKAPNLVDGLKSLPVTASSVFLSTWNEPQKAYGIPKSKYEKFPINATGWFVWTPTATPMTVVHKYAGRSGFKKIWSWLKRS